MQVIGAGFGRTGTLSLKHALEELGFGPTYQMQEVMRQPSHVDKWLRYARTGEADWDELFRGFGSGVDFPVSCVWEQREGVSAIRELSVEEAVPHETIDHLHEVYERHVAHVRATCPNDRLLVFDVADGWRPLCAFLNVPVPRTPFPHLNDAKVMRRVVRGVRWGTRAAPVLVGSGAALFVARARRRR